MGHGIGSFRHRWILISVAALAWCLPARAQYSANFQTNLISAVASNWTGSYLVGSNTFADGLIINSNAVLEASRGYLGYATGSSNNLARITDPGSVWTNTDTLYVGYSGSGNTLIITNAGTVASTTNSYIGYYTGANSNAVTVTGPGSAWYNGVALYIGNQGSDNSLTIANSGTVFSVSGSIGANSYGANNNTVTVTGPGSVWSNSSSTIIYIGDFGSDNILTITNGGAVISGGAAIGPFSTNNSVIVTGPGSVWNNIGGAAIEVGGAGSGNSLTIINGGAVFAAGSVIGDTTGNNSATVTGAGSVWSNQANLTVGYEGAGDTLTIANSGVVFSAFSDIGSIGNNNAVTVSGPGSVWNNSGYLNVGGDSSGNSLTIANGGAVIVGGSLTISPDVGTSNNVVNVISAQLTVAGMIVIGPGQLNLSNATLAVGAIQIGNNISGASLLNLAGGSLIILSNLTIGGTVNCTGTVLVTDGELVVTNGVLGLGNNGTLNSGAGAGNLIVSNGTVRASTIYLGSSTGGKGTLTIKTNGVVSLVANTAFPNPAVVANDIILDGGLLSITNGTVDCGLTHPGAMVVSNGSAICQNVYIGDDYSGSLTLLGGQMSVGALLHVGELSGSTGSVWVTGGALVATNLTTIIGNAGVGQLTLSNGTMQAGRLVVSNGGNPGTLSLQGGTLLVDLTISAHGQFVFDGGQLVVTATSSSNGQAFVVGNGTQPATMQLQGGTHAFDAGLTVAPQALLTGCGTISGTVVNNGTMTNDCGTLSFSGVVTNNGVMVAATGAVLNFNGLVVNNGQIEAANGTVQFQNGLSGSGTVTGSGTVLTNGPIDTTPPTLTILSPANGQSVTNLSLLVSGTAADSNGIRSVTVNGLAASLIGTNWSETVTLVTGTNLFTVIATDNSSNANTATQAVTVVQTPLVVLTAPAITNALLQMPSLAVVVVDATNVFTVGATNINGSALSYQWQFGDDVTNDPSALSTAEHIYTVTNCGPVTASVTISDGSTTLTSNLTVTVACQLNVTKLTPALNFVKTNFDSCSLTATAELSAGFVVSGQVVTVDIGGVTLNFPLNKKGHFAAPHQTCSLVFHKATRKKAAYWTLTVSVSRESFASAWAVDGLTGATTPRGGALVSLPVLFVAGNEAFGDDRSLHYTTKAGQSGSAK